MISVNWKELLVSRYYNAVYQRIVGVAPYDNQGDA